MKEINLVDSFDENHFIFKLRYREFDKIAGKLYIKDLESISSSNEEYISKELMSQLIYALIIFHNQTEHFLKELEVDEWAELHSLFDEIYKNILRINGVKF